MKVRPRPFPLVLASSKVAQKLLYCLERVGSRPTLSAHAKSRREAVILLAERRNVPAHILSVRDSKGFAIFTSGFASTTSHRCTEAKADSLRFNEGNHMVQAYVLEIGGGHRVRCGTDRCVHTDDNLVYCDPRVCRVRKLITAHRPITARQTGTTIDS